MFFQRNAKTHSVKSKRLFLNMFMPLIVIAIVSGAVLAFVSESIIKRYVQAEALLSIEELNNKIYLYFSPVQLTVSNFAKAAEKNDDEDVLKNTLYSLAEGIDFSNGLYFGTKISRFKKKGMYLDSTGWDPPRSWEPAERPWFQGAEADGRAIHFEEPYVDEQTGDLCVTVAKSVYASSGKIFGVVAVDLMMNEISTMVKDVTVSEHGSVYLVTSDGKYLTNSDSEKIMTANYFDDSAIVETASSYLDGRMRAFVSNGRYYAVGKIGETPWFVVAEGPMSDFSRNFYNIIIVFEILIIMMSIVFAVFNLWTITRLRNADRTTGQQIFTEMQGLVASSKENAATAQDQSAAVKEIVTTMEDNTALSEDISKKIKAVSSVAAKTNEDVSDGVLYLEANVSKLHEIADANQTTIGGIRSLGDKIENIWDIVSLINSVADQAKIIAFNAELEASSAGEAGKNFHIVATEIRRLADGIIDGTKEIKDRITEIQQSSDTLILASESGTEKIQEGVDNAKSLEERFSSIKNASEVTADSAESITTIIQQQALASEQILITLKQIAAGVDKFKGATESISHASQKLQVIAEELGN